uniref:(California timema) hypothetical protein n=1 Tax=Timema californicum TaxID=61474 RepID=A0A7R9PB16_TIMCA|nr:unnamed protein product [Timema californicum]
MRTPLLVEQGSSLPIGFCKNSRASEDPLSALQDPRGIFASLARFLRSVIDLNSTDGYYKSISTCYCDSNPDLLITSEPEKMIMTP